MNERHRGRLVRPWFLGASTVIFVLLIPVLVHSIWDYLELRRLDAAISSIERSGPAINPREHIDLAGPAADADRYYRAAAALASGRAAKLMSNEFARRLSVAEREDAWPPELVAELRSWVDSYDEALAFADRAALLPFDGFAAGRTFSYLTADLMTVVRAEGSRATVRALDGDAGGAVAALVSEARLQRPLDTMPMLTAARLAVDLRVALVHTQPSSPSLSRLAAALAEADQDDRIKRELLRMRAVTIESRRTMQGLGSIIRPWVTHVMTRTLAGYSEMIRVSDRAWPDRIDAIVNAEYVPSFFAAGRARGFMRPLVESSAERLALVRAARVTVAVEQYQRDHGEQLPASLDQLVPAYLSAAPIDPFTGQSLRLLSDTRGYTVYSAGRNRRDDGGRDIGPSFGSGTARPRQSVGTDVGIRIQRSQ
ncbi:MAG TPA: hypothetical protein VGJ29_01240 [Vicinamibacterales bacterium]